MKALSYLFFTYLVLHSIVATAASEQALQTAKPVKKQNVNETQIAFMPDIHFHDIYANFKDGSFKGLANSVSGKHATIRSLSAELHSTRLFNENYFAMFAALDDAVARGVKLIALPGDFSDDGQPVHMRGLAKILTRYAKQHNIEFFSAPGNHDPVRPFKIPSGKSNFLGAGGHEQRIFSKGKNECTGYDSQWTVIKTGKALDTICTEEVQSLGYQGIMQQLESHGFYPKPNYQYWETPYSDYNTSNYSFEKAQLAGDNQQRQYEICHQGTGGKYKPKGNKNKPNKNQASKETAYTNCFNITDASYLVEPIKGLWLLAIDANVYIPNENGSDINHPKTFKGSSSAGYNKMFTHKTHVIEWVADVVKRAKQQGKNLIAFSHFPMTEFYDGQEDKVKALFAKNKFQLPRLPKKSVSKALAETGLQIHIGGHMHINDTGVTRNSNGTFLFNIQAPSLAAYIPAYKLMTIKSEDKIEIETVVLADVPRYNELFEHYETEHKTLEKHHPKRLWNKEILQSKNYQDFTNWHISELTRQRFLPKDWPDDIRDLLLSFNGLDMLVLSKLHSNVTLKQWQTDGANMETLRKSKNWQQAFNVVKQRLSNSDLKIDDFKQWNGLDLAVDFYRLRNADQLALRDISKLRLAQYSLLTKWLTKDVNSTSSEQGIDLNSKLTSVFRVRFGSLFNLFDGFKNGAPSDHFMLNLTSGTITAIK